MIRCRRTLPIALLASVALGCSGGPREASRVDAPRAREALRAALDGWKGGKAPADFKAGSPPMTVQDAEWEAGARLVDYQVSGDGRPDDANLRVPVRLTLGGSGGKTIARNVTYVVGTSPSITVFRELFQ